jgi:hypothetical protein
MSDPAEQVAELRDRVEKKERELEDAVRELAGAARRSVGPAHWLRENPLLCLTGAFAFGCWIGSRVRRKGRDRR